MAINSKTVVSSMVWKFLEHISSQLVSFIISIVLARILMPSDYGIITIVLVFINIANIIVDGGLNTALIQKKNADQNDFSTIFWFCLFLAFGLYIIVYYVAPLISNFYNNEILTPVFRVLGLSIFLNSFNSIQRAYVSRHMLFRKLFYVNAIAIVISGFIGVIMAYQDYGVWALVGQTLSSTFSCCLLMWFTINWRPSLIFSIERFKGLFDYGWKLLMTNFIIAVYDNVRSLVIGKIYQPSALAYFDRGKSLPSLLMSNVSSSIEAVLLPTFSEEQDNVSRVKQMMRRSIQVSYFFVAPLLVWLFFAAKVIVLLLLTEKWLPAVPFIQIFCIAFFLMPIQNINMTSIQSLGYSGITLKLEIIKKIVEAFILFFSFFLNVYAVAWGVVLYNLICIIINLSPSKKIVGYGVIDQIKDVIPTFIASLVMGGVVYACGLLSLNNMFLLSIQFVAGFIVYFFICKCIKLESLEYISCYIDEFQKGKRIKKDK